VLARAQLGARGEDTIEPGAVAVEPILVVAGPAPVAGIAHDAHLLGVALVDPHAPGPGPGADDLGAPELGPVLPAALSDERVAVLRGEACGQAVHAGPEGERGTGRAGLHPRLYVRCVGGGELRIARRMPGGCDVREGDGTAARDHRENHDERSYHRAAPGRPLQGRHESLLCRVLCPTAG